jgi:hypothetical protein
MDVGTLDTVPFPDFDTLRLNVFGGGEELLKIAFTLAFSLISKKQFGPTVSIQAPNQPLKIQRGSGFADSFTIVPSS